jgi:hypothetical protein
MTDKKKYENMVSDIFDTFMQDLGDKLKEIKPDGDLANEKEEEDEEYSEEEKEEEDPSFSSALAILDKIIDDVMSKVPLTDKDMPDDLEPELDDSDKA